MHENTHTHTQKHTISEFLGTIFSSQIQILHGSPLLPFTREQHQFFFQNFLSLRGILVFSYHNLLELFISRRREWFCGKCALRFHADREIPEDYRWKLCKSFISSWRHKICVLWCIIYFLQFPEVKGGHVPGTYCGM